MTDTPKLCVECRHHVEQRATNGYFQLCRNPEGVITNIVTGKRDFADCYAMRQRCGFCGPEGKLWEAKK